MPTCISGWVVSFKFKVQSFKFKVSSRDEEAALIFVISFIIGVEEKSGCSGSESGETD